MKYCSTIISLWVMTFYACSSTGDCCAIIDTTLTIQYQDDGGQCILDDPNFDEQSIEVFYLENMKFEKVDLAHLANPRGFRINKNSTGCSSITIFLSYNYIENTSTTLVRGVTPTPDTIIAQFELSDGNEILESYTINGIPSMEREILLIR